MPRPWEAVVLSRLRGAAIFFLRSFPSIPVLPPLPPAEQALVAIFRQECILSAFYTPNGITQVLHTIVYPVFAAPLLFTRAHHDRARGTRNTWLLTYPGCRMNHPMATVGLA